MSGELHRLLQGPARTYDMVALRQFFEATSKEAIQSQLYETAAFHRLPIHQACRNGLPAETVKILIEHDYESKATLYSKDSRRGGLPIHFACFSENPRGCLGWYPLNLDVIKLLVNADNDMEKRTLFEPQTWNNKTPIQLAEQAVQAGDPNATAIVEFLRTEMEKVVPSSKNQK